MDGKSSSRAFRTGLFSWCSRIVSFLLLRIVPYHATRRVQNRQRKLTLIYHFGPTCLGRQQSLRTLQKTQGPALKVWNGLQSLQVELEWG